MLELEGAMEIIQPFFHFTVEDAEAQREPCYFRAGVFNICTTNIESGLDQVSAGLGAERLDHEQNTWAFHELPP